MSRRRIGKGELLPVTVTAAGPPSRLPGPLTYGEVRSLVVNATGGPIVRAAVIEESFGRCHITIFRRRWARWLGLEGRAVRAVREAFADRRAAGVVIEVDVQ